MLQDKSIAPSFYKDVLLRNIHQQQNPIEDTSEQFNPIEAHPEELHQYTGSYHVRLLLKEKGILNESYKYNAGNKCLENSELEQALFNICKEGVERFFKTPQIVPIAEIGWEIAYIPEELLTFLHKEFPAIRFEISQEQLLSLIQFTSFKFLFNHWKIDLKKSLGESEYDSLEKAINQPPCCIHVHGYVNRPSKKLTSQLTFKVLQFFSQKFPLPIKDFSTPSKDGDNFNEEVHKALSALFSRTKGHYKEWLTPEFVKNNNLLPQIVANEFLNKHPKKERKGKKTNPIDHVKIVNASGICFKISFSHQMPLKKIRNVYNNLSFPFFADYSPDLASWCYHLITQGIIDKVAGQKTPLLNLNSCPNDWKEMLQGFVNGETCLEPGRRGAICQYILKKGGKLSRYIQGTWKKAADENRLLNENQPQAALVLTLTACQILRNFKNVKELQNLLHSMKTSWSKLSQESSVFSKIAEAIDANIPFPLILAICELSSYSLLQKKELSHINRAGIDEIGAEQAAPSKPHQEKVIRLGLGVQTAIKDEPDSAYLCFYLPIQPSDSLQCIFDNISLCESHKVLLLDLVNSIQERALPQGIPSSIKSLSILDFESLFPSLFQNVYRRFEKKDSIKDALEKKLILQQLIAFILANFTALSNQEIESFTAFTELLEASSCSHQDFISLLQLMASSQIPQLNQTAYLHYKTLDAKQDKIAVARALAIGENIFYAAKAFDSLSNAIIVMSKEPKMEEECLNHILEKICDSKNRLSNQTMLQAVDLIVLGVERLYGSSKLALSEKNKAWLCRKLKLRGHGKLASKIMPAPQREPLSQKETKLPAKKEIQLPTQESLLKLAAGGEKNAFYMLEKLIRMGKIPEDLKKNPESLWKELLIPVLEKALKSSSQEAILLTKSYLPYLGTHPPAQKEHCWFVEFVIKLSEGPSPNKLLNKPIKQVLYENEANLFTPLFKSKNFILALNLAYFLRQNNIPLFQQYLCHLFASFPDLLENYVPESRRKIHSLFISTSSEEYAKIDRNDVYETCRKLILVYLKDRFDLSLDLFTQNSESTSDDEKLIVEMINHFPFHLTGKYEQFSTLSSLIKNPSLEVWACWNRVFKQLFIDPQLDVFLLNVLEKILQSQDLSEKLNEHNLNQLILNLLKINPLSPRFARYLSLALTLILKGANEESVRDYCNKILFCKDIEVIEKSYPFIVNYNFSSNEIYQECWLQLIETMLKVRSKKFKELLNGQLKNITRIFNPQDSANLNVYEMLLQGISRGLRKESSSNIVAQLLKAVEQLPPFRKDKEKLALPNSILLPYVECLSMSSTKNNKEKSLVLLQKILQKNLSEEENWDPFIKTFKKAMAKLNHHSNETIDGMAEFLLNHPQPELSLFLSQKLYDLSPGEHIVMVIKLLNHGLSDYPSLLAFLDKDTCKKEWIEKALTDSELYPLSSGTESALKCIQKPLIGMIIPQKKLLILKEKILLACLRNFIREFHVSNELYNEILHFALNIKDQIQDKELLQKLFTKFYCYCWIKNPPGPVQLFSYTSAKVIDLGLLTDGSNNETLLEKEAVEDYEIECAWFQEELNLSVIYPITQRCIRKLIAMAKVFLNQKKKSDQIYYTLIIAAFQLDNVLSQVVELKSQLSEEEIQFILSDLPSEVNAMIRKRKFGNNKLSLLKDMYLFYVDILNKKEAMDAVKFRNTLTQFMESDSRELTFGLAWEAFGLAQAKLKGFIQSEESVLKMIENFFVQVGTLEVGAQGFYYNELAKVFGHYYVSMQQSKLLQSKVKIFARACLEHLINFMKKKNHSFIEMECFSLYFPRIIDSLFKHDFSSQSKAKIFESNKLAECYLNFKSACEDWLSMETIALQHIELANQSIYFMIQKMPKNKQALLLNEWLGTLLKNGQMANKNQFLAAAQALFDQASNEGVYWQGQKLFDEAGLLLKKQKKLH